MAQVTNRLQKVPGSVLFDMLTPAPCEQTANTKSQSKHRDFMRSGPLQSKDKATLPTIKK